LASDIGCSKIKWVIHQGLLPTTYITNSNFYKHRKKLNVTPLNTSMIKVATANRVAPNATTTNNRITLLHGNTTLTFSEQCEPQWLADLLNALQS
jgi:hypothetical protein